MSFSLVLKNKGPLAQAIEKVDTSSSVNLESTLKDNEVLIQFIASAINPSDVGVIEGWYPSAAELPLVPGNEGVAKVLKVGPGVSKLAVGDHVIPGKGLFGTWRTHAIASENDLLPIDKDLDVYTAAQIMVNPPTAYRMLKDFVTLKPGDCVMQNGANSAVGLLVIQLCKAWGYKTINVVRARPNPDDMAKLVSKLTEYGADHVVTEEDIANDEAMNEIWSSGTPKPILAFECIGGENANNCIRHLADEATMVIYGTMTKKPIAVPAGPTIFKQLRFVGFWLAKVYRGNPEEYHRMSNELVSMFKSGQLKAPKVVPVKMEDYLEAFEKSTNGFSEGKVLLTTDV
uniref:Enoyl-[acyl-carrier-protein] reductase, mitochondrial n=1 Tax=Tetranychus truncatus TaxID=93132 RepID=A0A3G5ARC9_9ACAR|nr:NADH-ubiquinone oxidoreductase 20 kDa subunit-like [Tetranychus truncatus]